MNLPRAEGGTREVKPILPQFKRISWSLILMSVNINNNKDLELNDWPAYSAAELQPSEGCSQQ